MIEVIVTNNQGLQTNYATFPDQDSAQLWVDGHKANNTWPFNEADHHILIKERDDLPLEWAALRQERDKRLKSCDWTMLVDSPLSSEEKLRWTAYRQALRDLPYNTQEPSLVEWPNEPE